MIEGEDLNGDLRDIHGQDQTRVSKFQNILNK